MKSTTGAYGEFPNYYYKPGNLFGSYLLGKSARMSRDTRRELEMLEGGFAVIRPSVRRAPERPGGVLTGAARVWPRRVDVARRPPPNERQGEMGGWSLVSSNEMHEAQAKEFLDFLASLYGRDFAEQAANKAVAQAVARIS